MQLPQITEFLEKGWYGNDIVKRPNYGLTIEQRERKKQIMEEMVTRKEAIYESPFFDKPLTLPNKSVREWLNQPFCEYDKKNEALLCLQDLIKDCDSMSLISVKDKYKKKSVKGAYALHGKIGDIDSWIIIHEMDWGELKIHSISDSASILYK